MRNGPMIYFPFFKFLAPPVPDDTIPETHRFCTKCGKPMVAGRWEPDGYRATDGALLHEKRTVYCRSTSIDGFHDHDCFVQGRDV